MSALFTNLVAHIYVYIYMHEFRRAYECMYAYTHVHAPVCTHTHLLLQGSYNYGLMFQQTVDIVDVSAFEFWSYFCVVHAL